MDVSQPLRSRVLVERKDFAFFVELGYENLPDYCSHCNKIGHYLEICKNVRKEGNEEQVKEPIKPKKTKTKPQYVRKEQGKSQTDPILIPEQSPEIQPESDPTTGKAIVVAETEKVSKEMDLEFNNEKADDVDESSSEGSEFVENTEIREDSTDDGAEEEVNNDTSCAQELENRLFLQQSWANMAEDAEAEARLLADIEKELPNNADDFQLVVTKRKKKQQRAAHNKYATRSRTGKKNPSQ